MGKSDISSANPGLLIRVTAINYLIVYTTALSVRYHDHYISWYTTLGPSSFGGCLGRDMMVY